MKGIWLLDVLKIIVVITFSDNILYVSFYHVCQTETSLSDECIGFAFDGIYGEISEVHFN